MTIADTLIGIPLLFAEPDLPKTPQHLDYSRAQPIPRAGGQRDRDCSRSEQQQSPDVHDRITPDGHRVATIA